MQMMSGTITVMVNNASCGPRKNCQHEDKGSSRAWMTKVLLAMGPSPLALSSSRVANTTPLPVAASLQIDAATLGYASAWQHRSLDTQSKTNTFVISKGLTSACVHAVAVPDHPTCLMVLQVYTCAMQSICLFRRAPAVGAVQVHGLAGDDAGREAAELAAVHCRGHQQLGHPRSYQEQVMEPQAIRGQVNKSGWSQEPGHHLYSSKNQAITRESARNAQRQAAVNHDPA